MILQAVVMRPLTSYPHRAGTEHVRLGEGETSFILRHWDESEWEDHLPNAFNIHASIRTIAMKESNFQRQQLTN